MKTYMFAEVRGQAVDVPWQLLYKGSEVVVRGQLRPNYWLDKSGVSHRDVDFIALELIANDGKSHFEDE